MYGVLRTRYFVRVVSSARRDEYLSGDEREYVLSTEMEHRVVRLPRNNTNDRCNCEKARASISVRSPNLAPTAPHDVPIQFSNSIEYEYEVY
jgi:hypothetical protein